MDDTLVLTTGFAVLGFAFGIPAGILIERIRMNALIKSALVRLPGFPSRVAVISENAPIIDPPAPIAVHLDNYR